MKSECVINVPIFIGALNNASLGLAMIFLRLLISECIVKQSDADKEIAILGLFFKPSLDDVRESAATTITSRLFEKCIYMIQLLWRRTSEWHIQT